MRHFSIKYFIALFVFFFQLTAFAQKIKTVEASYTYHVPENVTLEQAKRTALERAQLEALATAFGTNISQQNSTRVSNMNGQSDIDFQSISSSDVKGEWIETISEPSYNIYYEQDMLVVSCSVRGKAREIINAGIELKVKVLRNGTEERFESSEFRSGDDLYLSFQSPVDGYLVVYLIDDEGNAFCLLPYRNQNGGTQVIKANVAYTFFSPSHAPQTERDVVDEYTLTCERSQETNQIVTLFSPNPFAKGIDTDNGELLPREMESKDFQKWLSKIKSKDNQLQQSTYLLTIKND